MFSERAEKDTRFGTKIIQITGSIFESFSEKAKSRVWHELLTLCFVKGTRGYVKKAEPIL